MSLNNEASTDRHACALRLSLLAAALWIATPAAAQGTVDAGWQSCMATADAGARLACFDQWAQGQPRLQAPSAPVPGPAAAAPVARKAQPQAPRFWLTSAEGCRDPQYSEISRFWELEAGSDCGTFGIRGYRPISLSVILADSINNRPSSDNPANTAEADQRYEPSETRLQLSIRTKLAQNLLTRAHPNARDSLWFGYTQQSYWQLFNRGISRPFRTTDHEPELIYVYPSDYSLPGGWRLRYTGLGMVHQSNGQALPLSRSWNRVYLMAGMEQGQRFRLHGRIWSRVDDGADDNPRISDHLGRGELVATWNVNPQHVLSATLRHSLSHSGRGSVRLEWLRALGKDSKGAPAGLRLHTQLFTGYGDSLIDFNKRRTVLSVGLSLVEW